MKPIHSEFDKPTYIETSYSEKGSILLELTIAIPLILFVSFTGFELSRSALIRLVMSDIVREATTSSYLCSFRDQAARANCFQEVINELQIIAANRFPADPDPSANLPGMLLSLEAYEVDESQLLTRDQVCASNDSIDNRVSQLPLRRLISIGPIEIQPFKKYSLTGVPPDQQTIGNLFPPGQPQSDEFMAVTCLNGSVFIAEVHLSYVPVVQVDFSGFFYGSGSQGNINWRSEFHAVVVL